MGNRKKMIWMSVALILINLFILATLFGLLYQFDSSPPAQWISILVAIAWFLCGPILFLVSYIDQYVRVPDFMYLLGAIVNALFWVSCVLLLYSKFQRTRNGSRKIN